jgi:uncharacterized membrane protein (UPF0136 family)
MNLDSTLHMYFIAFGVVSVILGVMGFVRAQSKASLIAGGVSGLLLIVAGLLAGKNGIIMGTVVSFLLAGRFLPVALKTKKFYPAGILAVWAVVGLGWGAWQLIKG